jgi:drug/metabolite transporter (DMT)-like permease
LRPATPWLAYGCLLGGMLLVGTYVGLSKPLTAAIPVFILALLRFALAALMMLHWLGGPPLQSKTWTTLVLQSFFGNFLFSICMLYGVKLSSAIAAGLIMSTLPAVVALMSKLFLHEQLTPRIWCAIAISMLGVFLLNFASSTVSEANVQTVTNQRHWGHALLFLAVCCEAIYVVTGKQLTSLITPARNCALVNLIGLAFILPLGMWQYSESRFSLLQLPATQWGLLVFYAFAASVGSVWLWMTGLRHVCASRAGVFTLGLPIAAVAVGFWVLDETLTSLHFAAFLFCAVALYLITSAPQTVAPIARAK